MTWMRFPNKTWSSRFWIYVRCKTTAITILWSEIEPDPYGLGYLSPALWIQTSSDCPQHTNQEYIIYRLSIQVLRYIRALSDCSKRRITERAMRSYSRIRRKWISVGCRTKRDHDHQILFPQDHPTLYPKVGCASFPDLASHYKAIESFIILRGQCEVSTPVQKSRALKLNQRK